MKAATLQEKGGYEGIIYHVRGIVHPQPHKTSIEKKACSHQPLGGRLLVVLGATEYTVGIA